MYTRFNDLEIYTYLIYDILKKNSMTESQNKGTH